MSYNKTFLPLHKNSNKIAFLYRDDVINSPISSETNYSCWSCQYIFKKMAQCPIPFLFLTVLIYNPNLTDA